MNQTRRQFLANVGLGAAALAAPGWVGAAQRRRPNILFILADDLGWADTTPYGSRFLQTPNIAALARRGMLFTNAYAANPLCSPTRASILTGLWPARLGLTTPGCHLPQVVLEQSVVPNGAPSNRALQCNSVTRLKPEYFTLAEALKEAGYATGHFGKWHLGPEPYSPLQQGFDVDIPHTPAPGPGGGYLGPWRFLKGTGNPGEHIEDHTAEAAVAFIKANKDRPFYMSYWAFSVHSPWQGKPELIERYRGKADPKDPQHNPVYGAMVQSLDDAVGTLMKALDEEGLAENTIIVFFSDNGGWCWPSKSPETPEEYRDVPITSNAPLRGGKATIYEGGTREPLLVVWPGRVRPNSRNEDAIVQSVDFYPTLLEMAGVGPQQGQRFDGISFLPALQGKPLGRDTIFCHFPHYTPATGAIPSTYVRKGDWKLIRLYADNPDQTDRFELYHLREDIGETRNLAERMPGKVKELNGLIDGFLKESGAAVPRANPAYRPGLGAWMPSRDADVKVAGGLLVIESAGPDPYLYTAQVPKMAREVTAEFRMRSKASGDAHVYWGEEGVKPLFFRDRMVVHQVKHDGEWHEYSVKLPVKGTLNAFRIDPANGAGHIEIDWIRLKGADGNVAKEWSFDGKE